MTFIAALSSSKNQCQKSW